MGIPGTTCYHSRAQAKWCLLPGDRFSHGKGGRDTLVYLEAAAPVSIRVEGGPNAVRWINARDPADR